MRPGGCSNVSRGARLAAGARGALRRSNFPTGDRSFADSVLKTRRIPVRRVLMPASEVSMVRAFSFLAGVLLTAVVLTATVSFHAQGRGGGGGGGQAAGTGTIAERTASMQKIDGYFPLYWEERTGT